MNIDDVETFVLSLANVTHNSQLGYRFYYVGDDHRVPFVTIAETGNEHEPISRLDRPGVYRINIGVGKQSFQAIAAGVPADEIDFTVLNVFLPHPDYAAQNFVCILNPAGENIERTNTLIREAHALAADRFQRRSTKE